MKVVTFSTLYPSAARLAHGIFFFCAWEIDPAQPRVPGHAGMRYAG